MAIEDWSIRSRLAAAFAAMVTLLVGVSAVSYWGTGRLAGTTHELGRASAELTAASSLATAAADLRFSHAQNALAGVRGRDDVAAAEAALDRALATLRTRVSGSDEAPVRAIADAYARFRAA